jgi:hypothetical protein
VVRLLKEEESDLRVGIGASAKFLRGTLTDERFVPAVSGSANTVDADFGALVAYSLEVGDSGATRAPYVAIRSGATVRNIFDRKVKYPDSSQELPIGGGLAAALGTECAFYDSPRFGYWVRGYLTFEGEWYRKYDRDTLESGFLDYQKAIKRFGAEATVIEKIALRAGHVDDPSLELNEWSWGVGLSNQLFERPGGPKYGVVADYASWPGLIRGGGEHVDQYSVSGWIAL